MTLDELKGEMEALVARIDETLAEEIRVASATKAEPWPGQALSVDVILSRDKQTRPASGYRVHVSLGAWFTPVTFTYTDR